MRYACTASWTTGSSSISRSTTRRSRTPRPRRDGDWVVFVEGHDGGYRAEVTIPGDIPFAQLARRLVDLTDAVALGEHPFLQGW